MEFGWILIKVPKASETYQSKDTVPVPPVVLTSISEMVPSIQISVGRAESIVTIGSGTTVTSAHSEGIGSHPPSAKVNTAK